MVIKSHTINELRKNAAYSRQYAAALIAHAERIEALVEAESMVADIGASQTSSEPARTETPAEPTARPEPAAPAAEPARTEPPAENSLADMSPSEPARNEPPVEPARSEPPAESPRVDAPSTAPRIGAPPPGFPRLELPRPNREIGVTQADAIKAALRVIGHPASLGEIFNTIKSQRIPVKLTSAENLRLVMSRSDDFETNASGQWQLRAAHPAPEFIDQANAAPEAADLAPASRV